MIKRDEQAPPMDLEAAAGLTLRTIGDTLRHVEMRRGERKALEEVSALLRRALENSRTKD